MVSTAAFLLLSPSLLFSQPQFQPPQNLGPKINTALHESDPFLTADGKRLFFVKDFDIWYADWNGGDWSDPVRLGSQINTGPGFERSPSVTPDGQKLFFVSDARQGFFYDIWVSTFDSSMNDWGIPVNLGWPVNTPGAELSAHLTPDGRHLYFNSESDSVDSLNPTGRCGIYVSEFDGSNWSIPTKVPISSCAIDQYPSITADGKWFYFDKFITGTEKSIFASESTGSGWGPLINLSSQIGDSSWTPFITPSGDSLFFNSNRGSGGFGGSDIWMSERVPTGVSEERKNRNLPSSFELYQNFPNPFNGRTRISFFVSKTLNTPVELTVFNLLGLPVKCLVKNEILTGLHGVEWDGTDDSGKEASSGLYFYRLKAGERVAVKKLIFLK